MTLLGFTAETLGVLDKVCAVPLGQPVVSDLCGALRLGGRPTRSERRAWAARAPGSCEALRGHIQKFPNGAYRSTAADLIAARRLLVEVTWTTPEKPTPLRMYVGSDGPASASDRPARLAAMARAQPQAERICRDYSASGLHRFVEARVDPQEWNCRPVTGGVVCGFEGRALCTLEERKDIERESCE